MNTPSVGIASLVALLVGCTRAPANPPPVEEAATTRWLCRPDRKDDPCTSADIAVTVMHADGPPTVLTRPPAAAPRVDCFYVYPTVDLELVPGNHENLADAKRALEVTLAQAGGLRETCALWVPLYRQVTIGTYLQPADVLERGLARGFADVERAFREYLAQAPPERKLVVIGHSQGGEMVNRLLARFFENDPKLRERLLLAMPIGAEVDVPIGGGTFHGLSPCTKPLETGCIVAYRTHRAGEHVDPSRWTPKPGRETVCVDPASLDGPAQRLSLAVFTGRDVSTPFMGFDHFYAAGCTRGDHGYAYLAASDEPPPDDARRSPVSFAHKRFQFAKLGLHILDLQLAQGDIVELVRRRAPR